MRLHYLQHVPFEGIGSIAAWAAARGVQVSHTRLYEDEPLPAPEAFDRLVVMGGPMNIYEHERHPWLVEEKAFLRRTIDAGRTVVGICLGAQLIADVLGAPVTPGAEKEIGWLPLTLTDEGRASGLFPAGDMTVFHWHGDTFATPEGAQRLAFSAGCANQAFLYDGRVLGLQFHLESTAESVGLIVENCADELVAGRPYIQGGEEMVRNGPEHYAAINAAMGAILDRLP